MVYDSFLGWFYFSSGKILFIILHVFVTWIWLLAVRDVMHETDYAFSIQSTWLCYWLDQFLSLQYDTWILSKFSMSYWIWKLGQIHDLGSWSGPRGRKESDRPNFLHLSTPCMDFVEIFNVLLNLSYIYFASFNSCWASFVSSCCSVLDCHNLFSKVQLSIRLSFFIPSFCLRLWD